MLTASDIVYISGPMTGIKNFNRPAFFGAAYRLRSQVGCNVLNPAELPPGQSWTWYMRRDVELLRHATAVFLLPGWQASRGAQIEIDLARMHGLKILEG